MKRRLELGTYFGVPIQIDTSWFVMLAVVTWTLATRQFPAEMSGLPSGWYWGLGLVSAVLLFVCVLLHELGHALTAKLAGIRVHRIVLFIFGGVAQIDYRLRKPLIEFAVAVAGPLVSLAIAFGCRAVSLQMRPDTMPELLVWLVLRYLFMVNLAVLIFNLLPGFPLDGGRVLRALLWAMTGDLAKATRIASAVGSGLGTLLFAFGVFSLVRGRWLTGGWDIMLGTFLRDAARSSVAEAQMIHEASRRERDT